VTIQVRPVRDDDREWIRRLIRNRWGDDTVVANGTVYQPAKLDGVIAMQGEEVMGLATYRIDQGACEIVTIDALVEGHGVGRSLIEAVHELAHRAACARLWVITTNDNERARAFYDELGFRVAAVREGAVSESRKLKPSIPLVGRGGIAITDEIEYERRIH
jgi:GNAT superfamily N-acetyltransferase